MLIYNTRQASKQEKEGKPRQLRTCICGCICPSTPLILQEFVADEEKILKATQQRERGVTSKENDEQKRIALICKKRRLLLGQRKRRMLGMKVDFFSVGGALSNLYVEPCLVF
jgi:Na+-translocating ferredoxin:NAD+ oxidoreductase RnfC subunit